MNDEAATFEAVCREAAAWCEVSEKEHRLRTPGLRPLLPEHLTAGDLERAVQTVITSRRDLLSGRTATDLQGRLLACQVNETIWSGESEFATQGFFDVDDRPPWDTWVASIPRPPETSDVTLISWVPSELVELVSRGIGANPFDCIFWLADADWLLLEWPTARALTSAELG